MNIYKCFIKNITLILEEVVYIEKYLKENGLKEKTVSYFKSSFTSLTCDPIGFKKH